MSFMKGTLNILLGVRMLGLALLVGVAASTVVVVAQCTLNNATSNLADDTANLSAQLTIQLEGLGVTLLVGVAAAAIVVVVQSALDDAASDLANNAADLGTKLTIQLEGLTLEVLRDLIVDSLADNGTTIEVGRDRWELRLALLVGVAAAAVAVVVVAQSALNNATSNLADDTANLGAQLTIQLKGLTLQVLGDLSVRSRADNSTRTKFVTSNQRPGLALLVGVAVAAVFVVVIQGTLNNAASNLADDTANLSAQLAIQLEGLSLRVLGDLSVRNRADGVTDMNSVANV
ncbi:hypothetical protein F503_07270 [Ophiostoma piceae UAMH 11346]|uniref:Uncharacterized protein n=1 Tax=Ophiostoma piceae (strain UAMH 11346) TaxID=1262450 RepID=S3C7I8_OPHP1|nr:hypothetical protein F503_07270 [Ophiostoma piceae UAMH 11346]